MENVLSLLLGVSLSAATGIRLFVPFLVMSIAASTGHLTLSEGFSWIGSPAAIVMFAIATVLEVAGYYIPLLDEILDLISTPAAVVAGIVITASTFTEISPLLKWSLALVAGGGAAGITKGMTDITRLVSTATTAGIANPALSTMELGASATLSVLAVFVPLLAGAIVIGVLGFFVWRLRRLLRRRRTYY